MTDERSGMSEDDVRQLAEAMGYELVKTNEGYQLIREFKDEEEVVEGSSLQAVIDFLKQ
jgi:hypothetical protein